MTAELWQILNVVWMLPYLIVSVFAAIGALGSIINPEYSFKRTAIHITLFITLWWAAYAIGAFLDAKVL